MLSECRLRAGIGNIDITPPVGIELSGWAFGESKGVLDNLYATCMVLDNEVVRFAIISVDLIGIDEKYVMEVRETIEKELGIKKGCILICATHTHSGPATISLRRWGKIDEGYTRTLCTKLVHVAKIATENLADAKIGIGRGRADGVTCNRCVKDGPVDPEVGVVRIDSQKNKMIALLLNFSCHPVTLHGYSNLISADFPGYIRRMVEKESATLLYTTGACGDINPAPCFFKGAGKGKVDSCEKMAELIAREALRVSKKIQTVSRAELVAKSTEVKLPLAELPSLDELREKEKRCKANLEKAEEEKLPYPALMKAYAFLEWTQEAIEKRESGKIENERIAEIQMMGINDLALVALPGELFVETGLGIKKMLSSKYKHTFIIELANAAIGYFPTQRGFQEGCYESKIAPRFYGLYSLAPEAEKIIKDKTGSLAQSLSSAS